MANQQQDTFVLNIVCDGTHYSYLIDETAEGVPDKLIKDLEAVIAGNRQWFSVLLRDGLIVLNPERISAIEVSGLLFKEIWKGREIVRDQGIQP